MDDLAGKVAVVTGGARGVGLGLARAFAEQRMPIVLADIDEPALQDAVASLRAAGAQAIGVATDVSDADAVAHLRDAAFEQFGTVQVLCNNATGGGGGPFCEPINVAAWEAAMAATVYSVLHGLNAFLPRMLEQGEGRIVRAIRARVLYVNTHKETLSWLRERFDRIAADADLIGTLR